MEASVIIRTVLPLWSTVIIIGIIYSFISVWEGKVLRGFAVAVVAVSLAILLTDLRSKETSVIERFSFNGVIVPETVETDYNMPVFDVSQVDFRTGVITGGYDGTLDL